MFAKVADGFLFWALRIEPETPLTSAYRHYCDTLIAHGIDPCYDEFFIVSLSAEEARNASSEEQEALIRQLDIPSFLYGMQR